MLSQMLQFIKYNTLSYDLRFVCPQILLQRPDECTTKGSKEDERQNGRSNLSRLLGCIHSIKRRSGPPRKGEKTKVLACNQAQK